MSQNNVNYLKRWYVCNVISTIIKQMLDGFLSILSKLEENDP